jgi:hypothetical protein
MATSPIDHKDAKKFAVSPKEETGRIGPNVSQKHRAILEAALAQTSGRAFNELLISMPDVGEDSDFARSKS